MNNRSNANITEMKKKEIERFRGMLRTGVDIHKNFEYVLKKKGYYALNNYNNYLNKFQLYVEKTKKNENGRQHFYTLIDLDTREILADNTRTNHARNKTRSKKSKKTSSNMFKHSHLVSNNNDQINHKVNNHVNIVNNVTNNMLDYKALLRSVPDYPTIINIPEVDTTTTFITLNLSQYDKVEHKVSPQQTYDNKYHTFQLEEPRQHTVKRKREELIPAVSRQSIFRPYQQVQSVKLEPVELGKRRFPPLSFTPVSDFWDSSILDDNFFMLNLELDLELEEENKMLALLGR